MSMRPSMFIGAAVAAVAATSVSAVEIDQRWFNHAVAACQPALPAFDGLIRKRPKGIANEGGSSAFVSCAPATQRARSERVDTVTVSLANRSGAPATASCTLVDGLYTSEDSPSVTRSRSVTTFGVTPMAWSSTVDNGGQRYSKPAVSCLLPPGVEIVGLEYTALDEVG